MSTNIEDFTEFKPGGWYRRTHPEDFPQEGDVWATEPEDSTVHMAHITRNGNSSTTGSTRIGAATMLIHDKPYQALGLYTVPDVAERAQVTTGLIYQLIGKGIIHTASEEYLLSLGWDPSIKKPKHFITEEEANKYLSAPRSVYSPPSRK